MKLNGLQETLRLVWHIDTLRYSDSFRTINKKGRAFLPNATIILLIFNLVVFLKGFTGYSFLGYMIDFIKVLVGVALVLYLGRYLFNGKAGFLGLFSCLAFARAAYLLLIPLAFFGGIIFMISKLLLPVLQLLAVVGMILAAFFVVYLIVVMVEAVKICHKIKGWQSFVLLLLSGIASYFLEKGFSLLIKLPADNMAGQVIGLLV